MSNKAWTIVLSLLGVALLGYYVYWFMTNFEAREREVRSEVSKEARRNPLLAAERFLTHIGRRAESVSGRDRLLQLPPPGDALLVRLFSAHLPMEREDALEEWLRQGGHLIVAVQREWDEESESGGNRFLDRFGVRMEIGGCDCPDEEGDDEADDPEEQEELESTELGELLGFEVEGDEPLPVTVPGRDQPLQISFKRGRKLLEVEGADWVAAHEEHAHLQQFPVGAGRLTVLSDNDFLKNTRIGEHDHALLLADLTQGANKTWLLYSSEMPSLLVLLWRNQPFLVVSVLAGIVLWLAYLTAHSGPRRSLAGGTRRSLLEHLEAAAAYAWRMDRARGLLKGFRDAGGQSWERSHHLFGRLDRKERCRWIAEHSGLSEREVESALYEEVDSEQDFVRVSAAQQRVLFGLNPSIHHRGTESTETTDKV